MSGRRWYWHPIVRKPVQFAAYVLACITVAQLLWWLHDNL